MSDSRYICPGEDSKPQHEMTQRINPTKQGYCLIKVPATGVFWSTVWSTIRTLASATPPPRVTIYVPDPRLGFWRVNFAECVLKGTVYSFAYMERGGCLFILLIRGVGCYITSSSSLKKRDNSVGSVGSVGKSEKFPENIL